MGRIYSVPYTGTLTNAGGNLDLFELIPGDDKPIKLRGLVLGQTTEIADAAEESLGISIVHLAATVTGSNGTSVTPVPRDPGISDLAAGFTPTASNAGGVTGPVTTCHHSAASPICARFGRIASQPVSLMPAGSRCATRLKGRR